MKKIILNKNQISQILELYMAGNSRKYISKKLKISEHAIRKIIEQSNLPERPYKYVGKRFGRLVVLSKIGTYKNGCPIVECICDCGNTTKVIVSNLTSSSSLTVSCGCYNRDKAVSQNPWPTEFKWYINQEATNRDVTFALTIDQFKELCSCNCIYCGGTPCGKMQTGREKRNGIDRTNNSIGYEFNNCVSCCWTCNKMKSNMTKQDFLNHIKQILHYQNI